MTNLNETYHDLEKLANDYVHEVYALLRKRNHGEQEFHQPLENIDLT